MKKMRFYFNIFILLSLGIASVVEADDYQAAREEMILAINNHARQSYSFINKNQLSPRVMSAMATVPRHNFVPAILRPFAYENRPLPIGYGQTISQPFVVALMTDLLELEVGDRVLEIGTGSGYQAAVLAELKAQVYSIEIIPQLGKGARDNLIKSGYKDVQVKIGDGYFGLPELAPFDGIIVTAAASHVPPPLIKQLKPGGKMVIPVGRPFSIQQLLVVEKDSHHKVTTRQILPVQFVPLTGGH